MQETDIVFSVPENIVVHLGAPTDATARNVTVPFIDYIKNVASSEIYPTWPENAIRANVYAQVTYALNRIFTEQYRSQGYNFDITNDTRFDQAYVDGRDIFENIGKIVDELFNDYIAQSGSIAPIFARYCSGTTSTCPGGLSQWGTVPLAEQGFTPYRILSSYYGDISLIENAPVKDLGESYPDVPLRIGSTGDEVKRIQLSLNRISNNYPAIPKIPYPDGVFDVITENAVRKFQEIFNLTVDGVVGKATWYRIVALFNSVSRLSELDAQKVSISNLNQQFKRQLSLGDSGNEIRILQYYLNFIAEFNNFIPSVNANAEFDAQTENAVKAFQQSAGLSETGVVDETTWNAIYSSYITKYNALPQEYKMSDLSPYPGDILFLGDSSDDVLKIQQELNFIAQSYPEIPTVSENGNFDEATQRAVLAYEREFGLPERGYVNLTVWESIGTTYQNLKNGEQKSFGQNPGYTVTEGR